MIKTPCVAKFWELQTDSGHIDKRWYIEDAIGDRYAEDSCESDCREIAAEINNAAHYRETLEKAYKELDPALFFSAIGYMAAACRMRSDIGAALADAGKGGGDE